MTFEETLNEMIEEAKQQEAKMAARIQKMKNDPLNRTTVERYSKELDRYNCACERMNTLYELKGRLST